MAKNIRRLLSPISKKDWGQTRDTRDKLSPPLTYPLVCYHVCMPTEYQASDYADRDALEAAISDKTVETKDSKIVGSVTDLTRLFLAHGDRVWGIVVEQTDYVAPVVFERPRRGELHKFGINKNHNAKDN